MGKRLFRTAAVGMSVGILLACCKWGPWIWGLLFFMAVTAAAFCCLKLRERKKYWYLLLGTAFFLAFFTGYQRQKGVLEMRTAVHKVLNEQDTFYLQGKLVKKQQKEDCCLYEFSSCQIRREMSARKEADVLTLPSYGMGRVQISFESDTHSIGEIILIKGKIKFWDKARNEGNFDAASFYPASGIEFQMENAQILGCSRVKDSIQEQLYRLKKRCSRVYESVLPKKTAGVLLTMVLGDKTKLDSKIKEAYQMVGISHILAISGLHVSVIGMLLYKMLRRMRLGFLGALAPSLLLLCAYARMIGDSPSVVRAVTMFFLWMLAQAAGRSYDMQNAAGAAAVMLLFENPQFLFYAGFQLSFAAVFAVALLGTEIKERTEGRKRAENIRMGIALQLITLPIVAWYYYEIPIYAVAVNQLLLPFVSIILICGIAGGVAGLIFLPLASGCLFPCQILLTAYEKVCMLVQKFPTPLWITGRPRPWKLAAYYVILLLYVLFCNYRHKKEKIQAAKLQKKQSFCKKYIGTAGGVILFAVLFLFPAKEAELVFLDVGQGDCSYICTKNGITLMIDGGSSNISKVGAYRMEPFLKFKGVRKVDYWLISHTDADHISGLLELLKSGYPIGNLIFAAEMERDENYQELKMLAWQNKTEIRSLKQGQTLHLGDAVLRVLFPEANMNGDKNAKSLVFRYEDNGISALFTGDISAKEEQMLCDTGMLEQVDFYKAAHHGSNASNSTPFLEELSPAAAVVSCAAKNSYGHPGKEAVKRMQENCRMIYYTMDGGEICVKLQKRFASFRIFQYSKEEF